VGADNAVTSCDLRILVDQAAKPVASSDADVVVRGRDGDLAVGWLLAEGPVRPVGVVVIDVFAEGVVQMSSASDEDTVGALTPCGGDPPLADRVRARCPDRRGDYPHAGRGEDGVERVGVLGIAVSDQELQAVGPLAEVHEGVPGLVGAENRIHSSDQRSCSPGTLPVMITDHVPSAGVPPDHATSRVAAAVPA
jgi:hypothetical protein